MKPTLLKLLAALAAATPVALFGADITINANITANTTWSSGNVYHLDGTVFVTNGATLTIQAGTLIKGKPRPAQEASALVIARGAKIMAQGSSAHPIIFTAEADDLQGNLTQSDRGLWGGVVILGRATNNRATGEGNIEGIPTTQPLGLYGGTDDEDSSGVFRYVSIRHAGSLLGPDNELNGLTLGSVGRGTTVEYVEVFANADDGYEFFGGTVNCKYLVSAFNDDDGFDWDEGYRGKLQFLFLIQDPAVGNQALECDGGTTPEDGTPYAKPTIYNYTAIGSGAAGTNNNSNGPIFRDNTGGMVYNSVFTDFKGYAWRIETESAQAQDSAKRLAAGDVRIANNVFGTFGAGTTDDLLFRAVNATSGGPAPTSNYTAAHITAAAQANRVNTNPLLMAIDRGKNGLLDPRPAAGSPLLSGGATPPADGFFTATTGIGAFVTGGNWAYAWTELGASGYFAPSSTGSGSRFVNISTRATVGANGANPAFPGFVITGDQPQTVLIQAVGPGLIPFGVAGACADPVIEVYDSHNVKIAESDDWSGLATALVRAQVGAVTVAEGSKDASLVLTLAPGLYSAIARAKTTGGDVLVEIYEVD